MNILKVLSVFSWAVVKRVREEMKAGRVISSEGLVRTGRNKIGTGKVK